MPSLFQIYKDLNLTHTPECRVEETDQAYFLSVDLAGVKKEDITIDVVNTQLVLSGKRHGEYGYEFEKKLQLGDHVNIDAIQASHVDGLLTIELPKGSKSNGRKVTIS